MKPIQLFAARWLNLSILLVICGLVGIGGVRLTLGSRAATNPMATIVFQVYEGSIAPGNELGLVDIAVRDDHADKQDCVLAINPNAKNGGTTSNIGDSKGRMTLNCPIADKSDSNSSRARTYTFVNAARAGYTLSPTPHPAGDTFTVDKNDVGNSKKDFTIVMTKNPEPVTGPPKGLPAPDVPPVPTEPEVRTAPEGTELGTIDMHVIAENGEKLGGVTVVIGPNMNVLGSKTSCTGKGTTNTNTTSDYAGARKGFARFKCPIAANNKDERSYVITSVTKDGYSISPTSPHKPGTEGAIINFEKDKGDTPKVVNLMMRNNAAPIEGAKIGDNAGDNSKGPDVKVGDTDNNADTASVVVVAHEGYVNGPGLGDVEITLGDVHNPKKDCISSNNKKNKDQTAPGGDIKGRITFSCPIANKGDSSNPTRSRNYVLVNATKPGYVLSANPLPAGGSFTVDNKGNAVVRVVLTPIAAPVAGGGGAAASGGSSSGSNTSAPTNPVVNRPDSQKNGNIRVSVVTKNEDGKPKATPGVEVHVQSVNYPTNDRESGCDNYKETTGGDGTVLFAKCWTGATGNGKTYQLSFVKLPANKVLESYVITGPSDAEFKSGSRTSTEGVQEQFIVKKGQDVQLKITLVSAAEAELGGKTIKQVLTQAGMHFVPAKNTEQAKKDAAAANAIIKDGVGLEELDPTCEQDASYCEEPDPPEEPIDDVPPNKPANFKAVQDESGAIQLSWSAATGEAEGEEIKYSITRGIKGVDEDPDDAGDPDDDSANPTSALKMQDPAKNLEYPQTYIYYVIATDGSDNESDPAVVEVTTTARTANVKATSAAAAPDEADENAENSEESNVTIKSDDGDASLVISTESTDEDLYCDVSDANTAGYDTLLNLGAPIGGAIYSAACTDEEGEFYEEFDEDFELSLDFEEDEWDEDSELYAYDGVDWELLETDEEDENSERGNVKYTSARKVKNENGTVTYTVKGKQPLSLALVKKKQEAASVLIPVTTLIVLVFAAVVGRSIIRGRVTKTLSPYPYGDVDLMPLHTQPGAQPVNPRVVDPSENQRRNDEG